MTFTAWSFTTPPFPSTFKLIPVSPPANLGPTQVLIEVAAAGLNPIDVQQANAPFFRLPMLRGAKGLGGDFSGKVIAKGSQVTLEVGQEVFGLCFDPMGKPMNTCLSQVLLADTTKAAILPKPTSMSFVEAGALPLVFATAATILSAPYTILPVTSPGSCPTTPTIVVLGGSTAVGIFAIQHAVRKLGARVITTCSSRNTDFVKSLGAELVIDYTSESVRDRLLELCPSEGFISIVDCVGGRELVSDSSVLSKLIAPRSLSYKMGGNFVTIVGDKSPTDRNSIGGAILYYTHPRMLFRMLRGWWGSAPRYAAVEFRGELRFLEEAVRLRDEGMQIPIDSTFEFEDALKGYQRLNEGRARGKVVVVVKKEWAA